MIQRIKEGNFIPNGLSFIFRDKFTAPYFRWVKMKWYGAVYFQWGQGEKRYRFKAYFQRSPGRFKIQPMYQSFIPEEL